MKSKVLILLGLLFFSLTLYSQQGQFSTELVAGPVFYKFDNTSYQTISQKFNYSFGLNFKRNIIFKQNIFSLKTGYIVDTKNYDLTTSDTISWYIKNINYSFLYGSIPFFLEYSYRLKEHFYPFVSFGITFGHLLKGNWQITRNDGRREDNSQDSDNNTNPKDIYFSLGLNYRLDKRFYLRFEPFLTYQITDTNLSLDYYGMLAYGFKLGVQFDFIFQKEK